MAIVRKYGSSAVAGLAKKAGEVKAAQDASNLQNQIVMQKMQQNYQQANLDAQLKNNIQTKLMDQQAAQAERQTKQIEQQARDRMLQDWELQKLQLRSENDFMLAEKEYSLKKEYTMIKRMQEQIDLDNKLTQLKKDVATGKISVAEGNAIYKQYQYNAKQFKPDENDWVSQMMGGDLSGLLQDGAQPSSEMPGQVPADNQPSMQTLEPVTGSLWWKKIHPEVIDPVLINALQLPQLSEDVKTRIRMLLDDKTPQSQVVLQSKLSVYNGIMNILQGKPAAKEKSKGSTLNPRY